MVKDVLRAEFKVIRDSITESERAAESGELCGIIRSMPEYKAAVCVLLYYPIGSEPDILPLAEAAVSDGKGVAFPVVSGRDMIFCVPNGLDGFRNGGNGIPEPDASECARVCDFADTLCVVPALAADNSGYRIGYGGGYYDRFLSGYKGFSVCAVFSRLFVDSLPAEPHDVAVGAVAFTGGGVLRIN